MKTEELIRLGSKYKTPLYIFDCDSLKARVDAIREKLGPEVSLCYAMKANPFLTAEMARLTDRIEVCSPGEMKICIREEISPGCGADGLQVCQDGTCDGNCSGRCSCYGKYDQRVYI